MSKDTSGNRKSSEGGQGQRDTKPVRQFLIPTHSRSCLDNLSSSSSGQGSGQSHPPQHCSTNRECSQCPGHAPAPAGTAALHNNLTARERQHRFLGQEDTTVPQPGEGTVHPHISAHNQFRTCVYQTQYFVSSSGHSWKPTNEQHRAMYQTFPWWHSPRLQVFLVQEISWTWCGLSP